MTTVGTAVAAAAVVSAGVIIAVMMVVVVALGIRIKIQASTDKGFHCFIRITACTAIQLDASLCQSHLSTAADATANEDVYIQRRKKSGQGTVSAAIGVNNFCIYDLVGFHLVEFELRGMTEMLKDLTVFIGYSDFHCIVSFSNFFSDFLN